MDSILTPEFFKSLSVGGVCLLVLVALVTDKGPLRLSRELRTEQKRNTVLEARNQEQSNQITTLTNEMKAINAFLAGVKQVAEEKAQ